MSAACSQVMAPLNARMMTSWIFMARSTAAAANTMVTSFADHGCTPDYPKSGHFTCSRERTDHVLPTRARGSRDKLTELGYRVTWHEYPMPHSVCGDEVDDLSAWLCGVLGEKGEAR